MTDSAKIVQVHLGERSYDITIGTGILAGIGDLVADRCPTWHALLITDENVEPLAVRAGESLTDADITTDLIVIQPGELSKSVEFADMLWRKCLELGADRQSVVVAVGGGVVGDLAGFVAATLARGLRFVQVPTTLLAQVDSSVGGKVGINLPGAKNLVGAFWQPHAVLIDTSMLDTLPDREYRAGLAEVIKYGVILDEAFFEYLESNIAGLNRREPNVLQHVVAQSCQLKAQVVEQDEREESGLRAVLNYGHTYCHAIESVTGYGVLLHGEAVAIGMVCASRLAERLGRISTEVTSRQSDLLNAVGLPTTVPIMDHDKLLDCMRRDKKTERGALRFILPARIGHVELVADVREQDVIASLNEDHG
ncbi:MAG: 3-dehydroquinate synthase [Planctomycetota bacterium]|nr:3-dehydroquinate synthase [Planctomycetota bacterium]